MNRTTKTWLTVAAVLVLLGVLGFVGVMAANHWEFSALGGADLVTEVIEIGEDFDNISIRSDTADIRFERSEDGRCSVEFDTRPNAQHSATVQRGTLLIEEGEDRSWYEQLSFSFENPRITVYLPADTYDSLEIAERTGTIVIPEVFVFEAIQITASTGDVDCRASASGPVQIQTDTGDIRVENSSVGGLRLTVSTGAVDLRSVVCEGKLTVTVSTGKTVLTDVSCQSFVSGGSTGDLRMERVLAADTISIERSTGDIRLEECDAAELYIQTDTGSVTGTLNTEKLFQANSRTGRVSVPDTITGGLCRISTNTGNIEITVP